MTQNRRSPTADIIDVFISIEVPNPGAFRTFDEKWFGADMTKCAHGRVYAPRNAFLRGMKQVGRAGSHATKIMAKSLNREIVKSPCRFNIPQSQITIHQSPPQH